MDSNQNIADLSEYHRVLNAFIELRGRGITASAQDLEVLQAWASDRLNPQDIVDCLIVISQNCQEKGSKFPATLKALDRHIRAAIRNSKEF